MTHALAIALSAAVPLKITEYRQRGGPSDEDIRRVREESCWLIASQADSLLYRDHREPRGKTAQIFNCLVDGLAVMAFCPGGVRMFGEHFEAVM